MKLITWLLTHHAVKLAPSLGSRSLPAALACTWAGSDDNYAA